jgi:hypothetical protein
MPLSLQSSYNPENSVWLRGNLHTHTTESDGRRPPQEVVDDYAARGYDFLMISDHDKLVAPSTVNPRGMVLIPGNEVSAKGPHLLHINAKTHVPPLEDRQKVLDLIAEEKSISVINHPNWQDHYDHCPQSNLENWKGYAGIEIFNGVIRRLSGSEYATDRWDRLLGSGRKVWGFANDDSHNEEDVELGWNVVRAKDRSIGSIVSALATGSFYASTGITLNRIEAYGRTLHVSAENAERVIVVADYGRRILTSNTNELTFNVPYDFSYSYVRVECYGGAEKVAWTQPFFIKQ